MKNAIGEQVRIWCESTGNVFLKILITQLALAGLRALKRVYEYRRVQDWRDYAGAFLIPLLLNSKCICRFIFVEELQELEASL